MKTVKDKYLVVGADFAGFPLKEVVVEHLEKKGWKILDLGVKKECCFLCQQTTYTVNFR